MNKIKELPHNHGEDRNLIDNVPEIETIVSVSDAMKLLGDPSRLRIFWILCHATECVQNIAALTNMSSPAVSHHLKLLKSGGLIDSVRHGKEVYYSASETALVDSLHHVIEDIADISCP